MSYFVHFIQSSVVFEILYVNINFDFYVSLINNYQNMVLFKTNEENNFYTFVDNFYIFDTLIYMV